MPSVSQASTPLVPVFNRRLWPPTTVQPPTRPRSGWEERAPAPWRASKAVTGGQPPGRERGPCGSDEVALLYCVFGIDPLARWERTRTADLVIGPDALQGAAGPATRSRLVAHGTSVRRERGRPGLHAGGGPPWLRISPTVAERRQPMGRMVSAKPAKVGAVGHRPWAPARPFCSEQLGGRLSVTVQPVAQRIMLILSTL